MDVYRCEIWNLECDGAGEQRRQCPGIGGLLAPGRHGPGFPGSGGRRPGKQVLRLQRPPAGPLPDDGYGPGRKPGGPCHVPGRENCRFRRLRCGRHHRHLPADGLPPPPWSRCHQLYPRPAGGGLRPESHRHPATPCRGRQPDHHRGLRHHRRSGSGNVPGAGH